MTDSPRLASVSLLAAGLAVALAAVLGAACSTEAAATRAAADPDAAVARGRYIVSTAGCHDCHTPFKEVPGGAEPDMTRALSGHPQDLVMPPAPSLPPGPWRIAVAGTNTAWAGPWGTSFTANLTPDVETGLGGWTEAMFVAAIRTGRHMGRGRPILPPMPWPVYRNLSDEDLAAVFAYLRTIPAISNRVPEPILAE